MDHNDFDNLGAAVSKTVKDALETLDFEKLNENIRKTRDDIIGGVKTAIQSDVQYKDAGYVKRSGYVSHAGGNTSANPYSSTVRRSAVSRDPMRSVQAGRAVSRKYSSQALGFPVAENPKGDTSGTLLTVFGIIGLAVFTMSYLMLGVASAMGLPSAFSRISALGMLPFELGFAAMTAIGLNLRGRIRRFRRYLDVLKGKGMATFKKLGSVIGKPEKFVKKDVAKMLEDGYFPEGHVDEQETTLMATDELYEQYRQMMVQSAQMAKEQEEAQASEDSEKTLDELNGRGKTYMDRIRQANEDIPDTDISNKLYRMELIVERIFAEVQKHPEKANKLSQFENYYMPMTIKLVETYRDLDAQPIQGENIRRTKDEIGQTLDTINEAYEKLYDTMYQETVMDVSSDITVLHTLMAQEGLTQSAFQTGGNE